MSDDNDAEATTRTTSERPSTVPWRTVARVAGVLVVVAIVVLAHFQNHHGGRNDTNSTGTVVVYSGAKPGAVVSPAGNDGGGSGDDATDGGGDGGGDGGDGGGGDGGGD
jgi:hypothetical protein